VPDFTFVATANAVARTGATPLFVDVEAETYNMDVQALSRLVERMAGRPGPGSLRLRMIMPVHQFGVPADMEPIAGIAKESGLLLIEDAACALGSRYRSQGIGAWGAASCFSFHPRKVITTGEGGAVVTNDVRLADRIRALRAHGFMPTPQGPELVEPGLNYRMTELQAALGIGQLAKLPAILNRRRSLGAKLTQALADLPWFRPPVTPAHVSPNWQSYVGLVSPGIDRGHVIERLAARGIETRPGATALHRLRAYREHPVPDQADCPISAMLDSRTLALPLHPGMSDADVARLAMEMREIEPR
jgi:dTDP-4-amino-4,6-dideoxygalactose transaminase